eukprot:g61576.t1
MACLHCPVPRNVTERRNCAVRVVERIPKTAIPQFLQGQEDQKCQHCENPKNMSDTIWCICDCCKRKHCVKRMSWNDCLLLLLTQNRFSLYCDARILEGTAQMDKTRLFEAEAASEWNHFPMWALRDPVVDTIMVAEIKNTWNALKIGNCQGYQRYKKSGMLALAQDTQHTQGGGKSRSQVGGTNGPSIKMNTKTSKMSHTGSMVSNLSEKDETDAGSNVEGTFVGDIDIQPDEGDHEHIVMTDTMRAELSSIAIKSGLSLQPQLPKIPNGVGKHHAHHGRSNSGHHGGHTVAAAAAAQQARNSSPASATASPAAVVMHLGTPHGTPLMGNRGLGKSSPSPLGTPLMGNRGLGGLVGKSSLSPLVKNRVLNGTPSLNGTPTQAPRRIPSNGTGSPFMANRDLNGDNGTPTQAPRRIPSNGTGSPFMANRDLVGDLRNSRKPSNLSNPGEQQTNGTEAFAGALSSYPPGHEAHRASAEIDPEALELDVDVGNVKAPPPLEPVSQPASPVLGPMKVEEKVDDPDHEHDHEHKHEHDHEHVELAELPQPEANETKANKSRGWKGLDGEQDDNPQDTKNVSPTQFFYDNFYLHLFSLNPRYKLMFSDNIARQGKMLAQLVGFIVHSADHLDSHEFNKTAYNLAKVHNQRGIRPEDYDTLGQALLMAIKASLGNDYTERVKTAWTTVFSALLIAVLPFVESTPTVYIRKGMWNPALCAAPGPRQTARAAPISIAERMARVSMAPQQKPLQQQQQQYIEGGAPRSSQFPRESRNGNCNIM